MILIMIILMMIMMTCNDVVMIINESISIDNINDINYW